MGYNFYDKKFSTIQEIANYSQLYGETEELFIINKFGQNTDVDSDVEEDLWLGTGTREYPGAAELFDIASTQAADTSAGDGARTVLIQGLDANYDLAQEVVSLNGTSDVSTVNSYVNIHRMAVVTAGSLLDNSGVITATGASSSNLLASITAGYNTTQLTHYMVPRGYTAFMLNQTISAYRSSGTGTRTGEFTLMSYDFEGTPKRLSVNGHTGTLTTEFTVPPRYTEKTLLWYKGNAPANNTSMSVQYSLLLIKSDRVK